MDASVVLGENETKGRQEGTGVPGATWRPVASQGERLSLMAAVGGGVVALLGMAYLFTRPIGLDSFLAGLFGLAGLVVALVAGGLAYGCRKFRYRLTPEEFSIDWPWRREVIPLAGMEGMFRGQRLGNTAQVRGISWPGFHVGNLESPEFGTVAFFGTTLDLSQGLLLVAGGKGYLVTPDDLAGFRGRLVERLEALTEEPTANMALPRTELPRWLKLPVPRDRIVLGILGAAFLGLLLSFGYVSLSMPGLPPQLALQYGASGGPSFVVTSGELFRLPLIGSLLLLANAAVTAAVHRWNRDAARVLAGATLFLELAMLAAIVQLVS